MNGSVIDHDLHEFCIFKCEKCCSKILSRAMLSNIMQVSIRGAKLKERVLILRKVPLKDRSVGTTEHSVRRSAHLTHR